MDIAECEEQDEGQRSNRAQAAARRNSSGSLSDVLAVVVADDAAVLAELHVRVIDGPGRRREGRPPVRPPGSHLGIAEGHRRPLPYVSRTSSNFAEGHQRVDAVLADEAHSLIGLVFGTLGRSQTAAPAMSNLLSEPSSRR